MEHWCSNCGSGVDGKTSEFFDFWIDLKKGQPMHTRTVICVRCQKSSKIKEMLAKVKEIAKLDGPKKPKKWHRKEGEFGCFRCRKKITETTNHIALSSYWDINHGRYENKRIALCKECYDSDPKTKTMWQFLASIGKNPVFRPKIHCSSCDKCPMFEKGNSVFNCKHIAVANMAGGGGRWDFRIVCNRGHPRKWKIPSGDIHLFGYRGRRVSRPRTKKIGTVSSSWKKNEAKRRRTIKKMEKAVDKIEDDGLREFHKLSFELMTSDFI